LLFLVRHLPALLLEFLRVEAAAVLVLFLLAGLPPGATTVASELAAPVAVHLTPDAGGKRATVLW
jgi:hypothetical protein